MADRIRWELSNLGSLLGNVGTCEPWLFQIYKPGQDSLWVLINALPGIWPPHDNADPEALKPEAEKVLQEFLASLGEEEGNAA